MDKYAVMGNPVSHSKSPQIHAAFAAQTGQKMEYKAIHVELDEFSIAVKEFFAAGGKGVNITVPFKQQAWELADNLTDRAQRAGAVNTLWKDDNGQLCGDTTDGAGLVRDFTINHGAVIRGKKILVLGAGGAVRGVLQPLIEQKPATVIIANRTVSKAKQLADLFVDTNKATVVKGCRFDQLVEPFDIIINGTAASLHGELPPLPVCIINSDTATYDMMYAAGSTVFSAWAENHCARYTWDGLGMLVEQAAESFSLWRGIEPQTDEVITTVRSLLIE